MAEKKLPTEDLGLCATAPNGPCKGVIETAVGSTTPATVQARITDVTYGAAGAFNMGNCDAISCFAECL